MSDTCLETQQLISLAYDNEVVTSADLAAAKRHCSECAACAAYVNGLARLRAIRAPAAPASVLDAAISAVRVERMRDAEHAATAAAREQKDAADSETVVPLRPVGHWHRMATWGTAAAAVFLVVGIVTWQGVRYLATPERQTESMDTFSYEDLEAATPDENYSGAATAQLDAGDTLRSVLPAPPYVVFDGWVYEVTEDNERVPADTAPIGLITTDFGSGTPSPQNVYAADATDSILIVEQDRNARVARRVTREFNGKDFGLTSSDITVFGTWPALTSAHPQPSSAEGMPEYDRLREQSEGQQIYVEPGGDPARGFAIAPGTPESDPARGNPNWTWWSPL
ncbi:MAG: hypothetical protein CVT60_03655 [Actinobacteria bacterium HGW-Actinobacteria-10]|jgi:negative regulator of sigma E activity|nr:MAG: hypothetical protein CVT60_03655 [Actinobacteria bacterium HGW-Actinobacteria-10]